MKRLIIFFLVSMAVLNMLKAQDIAATKLIWVATSSENLRTGDEFSHSSKIVSGTGNKILWDQKNGQLVYEFSIVSSQGEWKNVMEPGKMEYSVIREGVPGTIIFERSAETLSITLDFGSEDNLLIRQRFYIHEISPGN